MKQITLNIPDRDYAIVAKCAYVEDLTVEELVWSATKMSCDCDLAETIHYFLTTKIDRTSQFEDIWSPDIEKIMKGEGVA